MDGDCCQWTLCGESTLAGSRGDPKTSSSESKKPAGTVEISKEYTAKKFLIDEKEAKGSDDDEDLSDMECFEEQFSPAHLVGMEQARRGNMVRLEPWSCEDQGSVVKCHTE